MIFRIPRQSRPVAEVAVRAAHTKSKHEIEYREYPAAPPGQPATREYGYLNRYLSGREALESRLFR